MSNDQMTAERKARIDEGMIFLAAALEQMGITEFSANSISRWLSWDIAAVGARIDFAELDAFFGEIENRYHALRHKQGDKHDH